jgi:hypothetical protein
MSYPSIIHNGYLIEIRSTDTDYRYSIKKDEKLIVESGQGFPFPNEAEIAAKLYINRLIGKTPDGWLIS